MSQFLKISTYLSSSYLHTCLIGSVSLKNTDYYIRQSTKLISSKFGCQCVWTTWKGWTITRNAGNCDIDILNSYRIPSEFIQPSTWSNKLFFSIGVKSIHLKASFLPSCLPEVKATYYRHWKLNRNKSDGFLCKKWWLYSQTNRVLCMVFQSWWCPEKCYIPIFYWFPFVTKVKNKIHETLTPFTSIQTHLLRAHHAQCLR